MHRQPERLPRAPDVIGKPERHRWGAGRTALAQALVRPHNGSEVHHEPHPSVVTEAIPGYTPGATTQGRDEAAQRAIPPFHEGRLDRLTTLAQASLLEEAAGTTAHHPPADLPHRASVITDLDTLRLGQVLGRHEPGRGLASDLPPPPGTIHAPDALQQCGGVGAPSIRETERDRPEASAHLCDEHRRARLSSRSTVDPEEKPTPHGSRCMDPFPLARAQFGMRLIQWYAGDVHVPDHLVVMGLSTLGRHPLQAIHGLEIDATDVRGTFVTDTPPLTLQALLPGRFWQLAPRHPGALPLGKLPVADGALHTFDMLGRACPGAMGDVPIPGRLNHAHGGFGHENRAYFSYTGGGGVMVVLLWQRMDQKIQSRRQFRHVTLLQDYLRWSVSSKRNLTRRCYSSARDLPQKAYML